MFGVINARYTDKGGPGGVPSLTTIGETRIRQRKQQVEHAPPSPARTSPATRDEGGGEHRGSLTNGDWIELNGPFNLQNIASVTFRVADAGGGRRSAHRSRRSRSGRTPRPGRCWRRRT